MLIALISTLLRLFSKLSIIARYFPYVLSVMLFILSGPWFQTIMVLCVVSVAYEMMKYLVMTLTWYLYSVTSSTIYLESTAPGVEAQPYHLPWADPVCASAGENPSGLLHCGKILLLG